MGRLLIDPGVRVSLSDTVVEEKFQGRRKGNKNYFLVFSFALLRE